MKTYIKQIVLLILLINSILQAQLPDSFIQIDKVDKIGAMDIAVLDDMILVADYINGGLCVYRLSNNVFELTDSLLAGETLNGVFAINDTLFFASYQHYPYYGLYECSYQGDLISIENYIELDNPAWDVKLLSNRELLISTMNTGLKLYKKEDSTWQYITGIDYGGEMGVARGVTILDNNTIILANSWDGLRALQFNGETFDLIAHSQEEDDESVKISVISDSLLAVANGRCGLKVYSFNKNIFYCLAKISYGPPSSTSTHFVRDIEMLEDSTIFLADTDDGLSSYTFTGHSLIKIAEEKGIGSSNISLKDNDQLFVACLRDGIYNYRYLKANSSVEDINIHLSQNYPNPFNPYTIIRYQLSAVNDVELLIYDISGRKIKKWSYQNILPGTYEVIWNGKDENSNPVPSGVYIYDMKMGDFVESRKMVLLK